MRLLLHSLRPLLGPVLAHPQGRVPSNPLHPAPHTLSLTRAVLPQKSYGEVTLMDCLRLFTKEDVLDGDEKPVLGEGQGGCWACLGAARAPFPPPLLWQGCGLAA